MKTILLAISLLTRIPLPKLSFKKSNIIWAYPIVGLILGLLYTAFVILMIISPVYIPVKTATVFIIMVMALLTGAMHFDGIADTFDGIWGGNDKARRLEIMKDSHIGAYGTITLIFVFLTYYTLLSSYPDTVAIMISLIISSVASRSVMGIVQLTTPQAKENGLLNYIGVDVDTNKTILTILFITLFNMVVAYFMFGTMAMLNILGILIVMPILFSAFFKSKIGGVTGDCLGAVQVISEIIILILLYALVSSGNVIGYFYGW
ncbi:MAG: adenosylcobinamide-GDP ribazoletransferase [Alphaproteobacteria bacterium]